MSSPRSSYELILLEQTKPSSRCFLVSSTWNPLPSSGPPQSRTHARYHPPPPPRESHYVHFGLQAQPSFCVHFHLPRGKARLPGGILTLFVDGIFKRMVQRLWLAASRPSYLQRLQNSLQMEPRIQNVECLFFFSILNVWYKYNIPANRRNILVYPV